MKYFKKLSQAWWETFYIEQDRFNKVDEKLPTSRQIIVKFQNTGDRKKRFKGKMLFSDKENRDQNGFLFLNSNFFFFKGNRAIFSKFWRKTVFNLEFFIQGFLGDTVVKNLPCNTKDTGSIPGPGRPYVSQSN